MRLVARRSVLIERPRDEVFDSVADLQSLPRYATAVQEVHSPDALPVEKPGKRWELRLALPGHRTGPLDLELVECSAGEKIVFHSNLFPLLPRFDFDFRDVGGQRTRLQWSCRARGGRTLHRTLFEARLRRELTQEAVRSLENLKRWLETGQETMRAVELRGDGQAGALLELAPQAPLPPLEPGDVLIRVEASSIDPGDCRLRGSSRRRRRSAPGGPPPSLVPGRDVAGSVACVGSEVRRFRVGDAVWCTADPLRSGAWAEFVAVPAREVAVRPACLTDVEAAALPWVAQSVWAALVDCAGVDAEWAPGRRALVHAATSGVGSFAIQLLKAWGAWVAATCDASAADFARSLGADRVLDLAPERYGEALRDLDLALDPLGGEHESATLPLLARFRGAHYVSLAPLPRSDGEGRLPTLDAAASALRLARTCLVQRLAHGRRTHWARFAPNGEALAEIGRLVEAGRIRALVDRSFALDDIAAAHAYAASGTPRGRVVIRVAAEPGASRPARGTLSSEAVPQHTERDPRPG